MEWEIIKIDLLNKFYFFCDNLLIFIYEEVAILNINTQVK